MRCQSPSEVRRTTTGGPVYLAGAGECPVHLHSIRDGDGKMRLAIHMVGLMKWVNKCTQDNENQVSHHQRRVLQRWMEWEFPCGLVVRISGFHYHGPSSVSAWETEMLKTMWPKKKKKRMEGKLEMNSTVFSVGVNSWFSTYVCVCLVTQLFPTLWYI